VEVLPIGESSGNTACPFDGCYLLGIVVTASEGIPAWGDFFPGYIFVSDPTGKQCTFPEQYGWDQIWEIDPETGEVTLFAELTYEDCGFVAGLIFTPDGSRLRVAQVYKHRMLELDSEGKFTVLYDQYDGIAAPFGYNSMAYAPDGSFFVSVQGAILRFPTGSESAKVFADDSQQFLDFGSIAIDPLNGDLYFGSNFGSL